MTRYHIIVKAKSNESLTPLFRTLDKEFPDLDKIVDKFNISESKRPIFGAGDPRIEEIEIVWRVAKPDAISQRVVSRIMELIENSGCGSVEKIEYEEEENDNKI